MLRAIIENDQLLYTAISMSLFMIGYVTTTSFGLYFFKYAYGDENMYSIFALILGVAQISAFIAFPFFSRIFPRKTLYTAATISVVAGYLLFFFCTDAHALDRCRRDFNLFGPGLHSAFDAYVFGRYCGIRPVEIG